MRNRRNKNLFNDFDDLFNSMFSGFTPSDFFGGNNTEKGSDENGEWVKETINLGNGMIVHKAYYSNNKDNRNISEIDLLKSERNKAIADEKYEIAAELRDKIKNLEKNKIKLDELNSKLEEAISKQDFETAIILRDEIKNLK